MLVDPLHPDSVPLPTPVSTTSPSSSVQSQKVSQLPQENPHDDSLAAADQVVFSARSAEGRLRNIRQQNERQNDAAGAIRDRDRTAELLGQSIDRMKEPLQAIVKNFPPFSPQDKERVDLLRSYNSLRKEIDQLTFPPPLIVESRKEVTLPPRLPLDADDSQIADHLHRLDATAAEVAAFRSGIAADAAAFVRDGRFYGTFSAVKTGESAGSASILSESSAAEKSVEVGRQFASSVTQGVTAQYPQFLKGLS